MSVPLPPPHRRRRLLAGAVLAVASGAAMAVVGVAQAADDAPLKDLAGQHGRKFGFAVASSRLDDGQYKSVVDRHANALATENELKSSSLQPDGTPLGQYDFSGADKIVNYAQSTGAEVHGHALIWHQQVSKAITDAKFSGPDEAERELRRYVRDVVGRYAGRIKYWDVVNELATSAYERQTTGAGDFRPSPWLNALGLRAVDIAFDEAHKADPAAHLCYNDDQSGREPWVFTFVKDLVNRGVPINCVGFQTHQNLFDIVDTEQQLLDRMNALGALGLETMVSEIDVSIPKPYDAQKEQKAIGIWEGSVRACLRAASCSTIIQWNVGWKDSWIPLIFPDYCCATMFNDDYQPTVFYDAVRRALGGDTPTTPTAAPTTPSDNGTTAPPPGSSDVQVRGGSGSVRLDKTGEYRSLWQEVAVSRNTTYHAGFYYRGTGAIDLRVLAGGWGAEIVDAPDCAPAGDWQSCDVRFDSGDNTVITMRITDPAPAGGVVFIDDAYLGEYDGNNRLADSGFEGSSAWSRDAAQTPFSFVSR